MRLNEVQKQVKDTKKLRKSWHKTITYLLRNRRSRLLEALITLTVQGNTLPQCCEILGVPYYATVKVLRTDTTSRLLIRRARKHRVIDKREREVHQILKKLKG